MLSVDVAKYKRGESKVKTKAEKAAYDATYYAAHRAEIIERHIAYYAAHKAEYADYNAAHKQERAAAAAAHRRQHPQRVLARKAVAQEVHMFRFPAANTMVCEVCGEALAHHWHHHNGYEPEHALDVIAVCRECHFAIHKANSHERG